MDLGECGPKRLIKQFIHNLHFLANLLPQFSVLASKMLTFHSSLLLPVFLAQPLILISGCLVTVILILLVLIAFTLYSNDLFC